MRTSGERAGRAALALLTVLVLAACGGAAVSVRGSAPQERVDAYEEMTPVALEQVEDLWGEDAVARPVEVVLPATATEFAQLTGGAPRSQDAPAVTVGSGAEAHVVVHPDSWDRLSPQGRQAVLTHEVTHLAQQGDGPVPAWLGEGLAEYTAHRTSELAPAVIAGSALDGVRAGELPSAWPEPGADGPSGFAAPATGDATTQDGGGRGAWDGYAMSWLACAYLAETWSEDGLLSLYRTVSTGTPLEEAFPEVLGVAETEALAGWGEWLATL